MTDPYHPRFVELIDSLQKVLKGLEREIVAYRTAATSLQFDSLAKFDPVTTFNDALTDARRNRGIYKSLGRYDAFLERCRALQNLPIDSKIAQLVDFLKTFQAGHPDLFP